MNSSTQTRRPIGSSTALGYPITVGVGATDIHEFDSSSVQNGGPYTDTVTLYLSNTTAGALVATVTVASGTPIAVSIPANSTVLVFDGIPTRGVAGTPTFITALGAQAGLVAFGYFTRA